MESLPERAFGAAAVFDFRTKAWRPALGLAVLDYTEGYCCMRAEAEPGSQTQNPFLVLTSLAVYFNH
jgi:hypothetical protein